MKSKHVYLSLAISLILVTSLFLMGAGGCPSARYSLAINVSPEDSGSVSPSGGNYDPGVTVTIVATAASGYVFDHWSGDASGTSSSTTVVMDADKEVTAHFTAAGYEVLFSDDFSNPSSGWGTFDDPQGRASYENGYLDIEDSAADSDVTYSGVAYPLTDFTLEVETWLVGGTDDNWHYVLGRFQDEENSYLFSISADGHYAIFKVVGGNVTILDSGSSGHINQGVGAVNLMYIECIGTNLSLSVNGHLLTTVSDSTFSEGYFCLAALALSDDFTEIAFDNLVITGPAGGGQIGGGETGATVPFSDDFSQDTGNWDTYDESSGRVSYQNGCLYVKDYEASAMHAASLSSYYGTDFVLEVEPWLVGGTDNNWQVVLCRLQDLDNNYAFGISADGYYQIQKTVEGEQISLVSVTNSAYINQGTGAVNLMHIECVGTNLSLSVNGHLLATVTDSTFSGGYFALCAAALDDTYTEVAFANLVTTEPTAGGGETGGGETGGEVLFSDDFSDPSSGWEVYSDMGGEVLYKSGWLHLTDYTSIPARTDTMLYEYFDDFSLTVDTKLITGTTDNWQEVICRWQDNSNYYIFAISADGYYAISRVDNGAETLLSGSSSPYINQGTGVVNTIQIVCISSNLSLLVNGYLMDTVIDSNFYGGYIGLAADAMAGTATHIAFDNLVITQAERD